MLLKNKLLILFLAVFAVTLSGCSASKAPEVSMDVLGIHFGMAESEADQLISDKSESEPCVYGYEKTYASSGITLGFSHKGTVRRVNTKKTGSSVLGIAVGSSLADGKDKALELGYESTDGGSYTKGNLELKFLNSEDVITGITIEYFDE